MESETPDADVVQVEDWLARQPIDAMVFLPFLVARLRSLGAENEVAVTVLLRDINEPGEVRRDLRLRWHNESEPRSPLGVGDKTLTEFAACGIANIVSTLYARIEWGRVAEEGDGFDYWVPQDGTDGIGLEVSGTMSDEESVLESRHREKTAQLLGSRHRVDGYVVVVSFALRRAIVSFHYALEEEI